ncbi:hypothetical protein H6F67_20340 [Microcoleus sp. FACHB-1515]|uniref:hypothetical protein n=1 Tax=Cyanophyceae TaxID=3028117 RepID=UPI001685C97C|nr:hypothetical protein [Microcoleus sp. FACHB-1515]MBD2092203.1 hypothetical protein [Microcoleus sp. FACHB-1515]
MRQRFLLFVLLGLILFGCQPSTAQQRRQVDRLPRSFATLEQVRVEGYRSQQPFGAQAQQDFEQVERAIAATGVQVNLIQDLKYDANGTLVGAAFVLPSGHDYVYAPAYKTLPASLPNELEYRRISQDWYFVWHDWN